jgi:hypothetical protein
VLVVTRLLRDGESLDGRLKGGLQQFLITCWSGNLYVTYGRDFSNALEKFCADFGNRQMPTKIKNISTGRRLKLID